MEVTQKIESLEDVKSGYVVELFSGTKFLVCRAGIFTKILLVPQTGEWVYLSHFNSDFTKRVDVIPSNENEMTISLSDDIKRIYGLVQCPKYYNEAFSTITDHRELLWQCNIPKMTKEQIEAALGYRIDIIDNECIKDESSIYADPVKSFLNLRCCEINVGDMYIGSNICKQFGCVFWAYNYIYLDPVSNKMQYCLNSFKQSLGLDYKIVLKRVSDDFVMPDNVVYKVIKCNKN